ncbi:YHYH protein [Polynucleobacter arcticus]
MKFKTIAPLKEACKIARSKVFTTTGLVFSLSIGSAAILASCGGGGSDSSSTSSSASTEITTLVTSVNGVSNVICQRNAQCIDFIFAGVAQMPTTLSQLATPYTNTSTNIITLSQIPFVQGENSATAFSSEGSVFQMSTNPALDVVGFPGQGTRLFIGNGLPTTPMGNYPVQPNDPAYSYYAALPGGVNPAGTTPATGQPPTGYVNAAAIGISPYPLEGRIPLNPVVSGAYPINSLIVGITLTGAAWHVEKANDASGNYYNPLNALPNDKCYGHPYNQQYHYHSYSWKCFDQGTSGKQSPVYGFALDGFPITGPRGPDGKEWTNADLDICHGRESELDIPDGRGGFTKKLTYHYVLNREYPHSVGCFRGKVNYNQALGPDNPPNTPPGDFGTNPFMKEGFLYQNVASPTSPIRR